MVFSAFFLTCKSNAFFLSSYIGYYFENNVKNDNDGIQPCIFPKLNDNVSVLTTIKQCVIVPAKNPGASNKN